jgi:EAL domain-containing protein (putative c-di-GMP-specific phosphodiesterase class I)/DNA-binding CsgD family transcriptional regulator
VDAYQVLSAVGITVTLSVNISAQNLHDLTFPDRIAQRLQDGGMPARHLCLEITETAAFKDTARTMDILARLRLKGIQLSIDDFGSGYSSLKMLRQMPFTEIKIDQSFIKDLMTSRDSRTIAKSIMDLAANMGMACVAEGIETEEIAAALKQMGTCGLQGYFFGRPMPVEAVHPWWMTWMQRETKTVGVLLARASEAAPCTRAEPGPGRPGSPSEAKSSASRLSPRQTEVMQLLSTGCSVKEIARQLGLGIGTIKVHLSQAYSSLGAHNRVEAVMRAGLYAQQRQQRTSLVPRAGEA